MRVINFNAGPSGMPLSVLEKAKDEFLSYKGLGLSIIEMSHRSAEFEAIVESATSKVRKLYGFGDEYAVLYLQGGASLQFAQIPMNISTGKVCEYIDTDTWTNKAIKEAKILGANVKVVASSESENFNHIPATTQDDFSKDADYTYICSNNTIRGTQYKEFPKSKSTLVIDSSSDLFSRPIDLSNVGVFYGGVQKNAGPAGVTLVVIKKELADRVDESKVPSILRYTTQIKANSMSNTPNTFGIYMLDLMLDWVIENGGLSGMQNKNIQKARLLYSAIDEMSEFYKGHAKVDSRSLMNVTFNLASADLESKFANEAKEAGMIGLKGHRSVGGIRASIYNAVSLDDVKTLVEYMREFARKNG